MTIQTEIISFTLLASTSTVDIQLNIPFLIKKLTIKSINQYHPQGGGAHNFFVVKSDLVNNKTFFSIPELTFSQYHDINHYFDNKYVNGSYKLSFYQVNGVSYTHGSNLKLSLVLEFHSLD